MHYNIPGCRAPGMRLLSVGSEMMILAASEVKGCIQIMGYGLPALRRILL